MVGAWSGMGPLCDPSLTEPNGSVRIGLFRSNPMDSAFWKSTGLRRIDTLPEARIALLIFVISS